MKPILFAPGSTDFTTNGVGRLSDMIICEVTQERNGVYELYATVSVNSRHFADITHSAIIGAVPDDGGRIQPFRIYKISKPLNGIVAIYARHNSYELAHIPTRPFTAANVVAALQGLKNNAMQACPFTFWTDKNTIANYTQTKPESIRARLGGQVGSILDVYGGEYEFDNYTVRLWNNRGSDNGVTLRYGKNITDIKQEENIENTITGIVPYWCGGDNETVYYDGIVEADTADNFPYKRTVPYDFSGSFTEKPTAAQLKATAERYIIRNKIGIPSVSIKVSFVALWQTEEYKEVAPLQHVKLCDTVTIQFEKLGISAKAKVVKTVYDVLKERYSSIELGEARSDFASYVVGLNSAVTSTAAAVEVNRNQVEYQINDAIQNATDEILGAKGGNIVTKLNEQGQPYELLIMDNTDIQEARNVWRWNIGGLGFSSSGYNGLYRTAITQSGSIVADFITAGVMTANVIRAGVIQDLANRNYWNLETGDLVISGQLNAATGTFSGTISGGSISIGGSAGNPIFAVDTSGRVTMKNFDLDGVGNAATIGCFTLSAENLRAGTAVIEGDLHMNGGEINAGDIEASTVSAGTVNCGRIYCQNPPWSSIYDYSDERLKEKIKSLNKADALKFILSLDPKSFTLINEGRDALGFIAQDIQAAAEKLGLDYPLIKQDNRGYLGLNYQNLIALIVASIQELSKG